MLNALWPFWVFPIWKDYKNKNRLSDTGRKSGLFADIECLIQIVRFPRRSHREGVQNHPIPGRDL